MKQRNKEEYYKQVITEYAEGLRVIKGEHPEEVVVALDTFFAAGKMLIDNPEIQSIPGEYIEKLLRVLSEYPQYQDLVLSLIQIVNGDNKG